MAEDGVTIEFLSRDKLAETEFDSKLDLVLDKVKDNSVLVLEESWSPKEKRKLIERSMKEADEDFPGIEFMGIESGKSRLDAARNFLYTKLLNQEYRSGLTIVGNSRVIEKIKEEKDKVSFLAKLEEE